MIENKEIILSTSRNLNFYLLDYKEREVQNELDLTYNTLILSKFSSSSAKSINSIPIGRSKSTKISTSLLPVCCSRP